MNTTAGPEESRVVLELVPGEDEWGSRDDRWRADVYELQQELSLAVPDAVRPPEDREGSKGLEWAQVVVELVSAGALTATVAGMKAWLNHGRRSITARWRVVHQGRPETGEIVIDAANVDDNVLTEIANGVFRGVGHPPATPGSGRPTGGDKAAQ